MASPQKENGNIQIATEIWEHLTKIRIPGEARQVLDWILRKTYGWNKKTDKISLSQFEEGTGLKKNTICKVLVKLQAMNLISITQLGNEIAKEYAFIKDYDKWKPLPKKVILPNKVTSITQKGKRSLPNRGTTINTSTIDTTKDTRPQSGDEKKLFNIFYKTINPTISFENKTEWKAAKELIEKFGIEKILKTAEYAISVHGKPYAPNIATPYQLKVKLADLMAYYKKENSKQTNQILKL